MRLQDFRIGWRTLQQDTAYSVVVIGGLSVGLAACLLLLGFVRYSWQYNASVPDVEHVYVIKLRYNLDPVAPWFDQAPYALRLVAQQAPGVIGVSGFSPWSPTRVRIGNQLQKLHIIPVLPGFASLIGLHAVEGDLQQALERPEAVAITRTAAVNAFGTAHALGKTILSEGKVIRVAAIVSDMPANSTMPFEALVGTNSLLLDEKTRAQMLPGGDEWGKLLVHIKPDSSISTITDSLQRAVDQSPLREQLSTEQRQRLGKRKVLDIKLSPLSAAYFDQEVASNPIALPGPRGDVMVVGGLAAIAVLILVLAAINYVNLATVRVLQRQREIGIRKVLGAGTRAIILQFMAESLLVAMLATGLGLLLAWLALPLFADLINRKLDNMFSLTNISAALLLGVLLGTVAAIYPAWIALHIRPSQVLAGRPDMESTQGRQLRRIMTIVQISVGLGLTSVTLAIAWQTHFARHASVGFDPSPLLIVDLPVQVKVSPVAQSFVAELLHQAGVAGVSISTDAIGRNNVRWGQDMKRAGGNSIFFDVKSVSANFFEQYKIQAVAGRLFNSQLDHEDDPEPMVINTVAVRELGFSSPQAAVGQTLLYTTDDGKTMSKRIIGVAPDLRFFSLHEPQRATSWELWTRGSALSVRAAGAVTEVERAVARIWPKYFPDAILETHRAADILAANYEDDVRLAKLLAMSSTIALLIAAFGVYAVSAYTVQRRAKEIVLRKLYGANRRDIAKLVTFEIAILISLAAAIALPLAGVGVQRYLASYVEMAPGAYWTLSFALIVIIAMALLAVARQTWIAIHITPANVLKS